ncbi:MAG: DUF2442 domain-containing protein [Acidobacteria bacterium]|nr:DUF2442 domain-containing protein [Acidobacteriota bacterium]
MIDVTDVRYVKDYILWLRFEDGTEGEVDLAEELHGPIFEPLVERSYFTCVRVNHDTGTVEWPNGADFAPEFLYEKAHVAA